MFDPLPMTPAERRLIEQQNEAARRAWERPVNDRREPDARARSETLSHQPVATVPFEPLPIYLIHGPVAARAGTGREARLRDWLHRSNEQSRRTWVRQVVHPRRSAREGYAFTALSRNGRPLAVDPLGVPFVPSEFSPRDLPSEFRPVEVPAEEYIRRYLRYRLDAPLDYYFRNKHEARRIFAQDREVIRQVTGFDPGRFFLGARALRFRLLCVTRGSGRLIARLRS